MIFRQFQESESSTYTYLLACRNTRCAAIIDPVVSEIDSYLATLAEHGLTLRYILDTHVHADHITAAGKLREATGAVTVLHESAGVACADHLVDDGDELALGRLTIRVLHTPGHTPACVSYHCNDRVFTGDALLINGCGRTDFQGGDPGTLYDSIHGKLFCLPHETLIYPGHDYKGREVSSVGEQRALNERLGGDRTREGFIELMNNLDLPYPKKIQESLPANQACGNPARS